MHITKKLFIFTVMLVSVTVKGLVSDGSNLEFPFKDGFIKFSVNTSNEGW